MLKIEVCATSANLCVGYDVLGIALDIKNSFTFSPSKSFLFGGFEDKYANLDNLVYRSYCYVFSKMGRDPIPVKIEYEGAIPISRGLGSSSSLIVAGVFAANNFLNQHFTKEELFNFCVELEGHPDNVAAAIYGGLVASFQNEGSYIPICYEVSEDLCFTVIIPPYEVSTTEARAVLPKQYSITDIHENLSRIIHIPLAFKTGNIGLLRALFQDRIHEPYRKALIPEYEFFKELCKDRAFAISGSGSTMLAIGKNELNFSKEGYRIETVKIAKGIHIITEE